MPVSLNYEHVRDLAKRLSTRIGREVKITEIYEDMAGVFGQRPDAFMHKLKHEVKPQASKTQSEAAYISSVYDFYPSEMELEGFVSWLVTSRGSMSGGICILVTTQQGNPYDADPDKLIWSASLVYRDAFGITLLEGRKTPVSTLRGAITGSSTLKEGHLELFDAFYGQSLEKAKAKQAVEYQEAKNVFL